MTGRACPRQVAMISAGAGRVRVFLTTSPAMRGSASVAFRMQARLSSAWLFGGRKQQGQVREG